MSSSSTTTLGKSSKQQERLAARDACFRGKKMRKRLILLAEDGL